MSNTPNTIGLTELLMPDSELGSAAIVSSQQHSQSHEQGESSQSQQQQAVSVTSTQQQAVESCPHSQLVHSQAVKENPSDEKASATIIDATRSLTANGFSADTSLRVDGRFCISA